MVLVAVTIIANSDPLSDCACRIVVGAASAARVWRKRAVKPPLQAVPIRDVGVSDPCVVPLSVDTNCFGPKIKTSVGDNPFTRLQTAYHFDVLA